MPLIQPFRGLRPVREHASDVVAPPYDVLNTAEARQRVKGHPLSFLHISKPEIDLPEGTDPYSAEVYKKGAENLKKLIDDQILMRDEKACYYVYRLIMGEHQQTGLVVAASVADYDTNRIRKHEYTRPDKEDDRVHQIDALNAQTGPVFLTYRNNKIVEAITDKVSKTSPTYDITADDGVKHTIWLVSDDEDINILTSTFDAMDCLYIADGHHRSASASRIAAKRNKEKSNIGSAAHDYFLSVIFPDNQMQILDYNRVITDLNGLSEDELISKIKNSFSVEAVNTVYKPQKSKEFSMYLKGQWYKLQIKPELIPENDPVASLDISLLQNNLIAPLLGISDPRRDKRIDFVGGIRGLSELEKRVNSGEMQVAFALYPTSLTQLMDVADANEVMPPKSTWFEPKLADGLISHVLD
ncbi:MAG: DUF1015 family protein [Gammaproteobacteria bacterium]|nr:DUF1015 family protein [Gammaproteobacteria bacterium]MDH5660598.1 DUF1015 family protein [Gammaproteobacteria bacterium]